ncbi:MAG: zinc metalloprotease HtpX [Betaproteobacteria bacterium]|nr:zinc metalloprotease HtpX [Betaproteobacteria bacterium]
MLGNWLKTTVLMATILSIFGGVGLLLGGPVGMLFALLLGGAMNFWAYWFSDRMVLRLYKAQEVDETTAPQYVRMVRELSAGAGLPMPRVYLIDEEQPNAFATGRNPENAAVAATTGILRVLTERELRGVMAHELAHVKHRDILISTMSATVAGAVSSLAQFGGLFGGRDEEGRSTNPVFAMLAMIVAPFAAMMVQMAISRAREFEADRGGAEMSGDPQALASALEKIHRYGQGVPLETAETHPATAQMMIINPLAGGGLAGLFSTHPDTGERIARLQAMTRALARA